MFWPLCTLADLFGWNDLIYMFILIVMKQGLEVCVASGEKVGSSFII